MWQLISSCCVLGMGEGTGLSALTLHAPRWCLEKVGGYLGLWVGMITVSLQDTEGGGVGARDKDSVS